LLKPYLLPSTPAAADDAGENDVDETKALPDGDGPLLSILKIGCRGLVLLKLNSTTNNTEENQFLATAKRAQQAVLKIYDNAAVAKSDSDSAVQQKPVEFIQRLVPILSTCAMEEDALKACAARVAGIAALEFGNTTSDGGEKVAPLPPTFGIHINNRELGSTGSGGEGTPSTSVAVPAVEPPAPSLERMQIISAVAAGLTTELKNKYNIDAKVNLKAPTVVVNVEILPIMGKTYAGIAILPQRVCNLKPKLGIKPLRQNNDTSGGSGKGKAKKEKSAVPS
jgi:tRNA(Ser,Leu) C12 N-acetylase TAN1